MKWTTELFHIVGETKMHTLLSRERYTLLTCSCPVGQNLIAVETPHAFLPILVKDWAVCDRQKQQVQYMSYGLYNCIIKFNHIPSAY